jgi:hypothetical protein
MAEMIPTDYLHGIEEIPIDVIVGADRAKIAEPESGRLESFGMLEEIAKATISCVAWYLLPIPCLQATKLPPPRPSSSPFPATSTRPGFAARPRPTPGRMHRLVLPERNLGESRCARALDTEYRSPIE